MVGRDAKSADHVVVVVNPKRHALVKKSLVPFVKQRYLIDATWIIHIAPIFCLVVVLSLSCAYTAPFHPDAEIPKVWI